MKKFNREEIESKVNGILVDKLGIDEGEIRPESMLGQDLTADSIDIVDITIELERDFNISIPDDTMGRMYVSTVKDVYDTVEGLCR